MPRIGRRLLVIATIEVAVILDALVLALAIFAFSAYIGSIRADVQATAMQVQDEIAASPGSAAAMGQAVANRYLRPDVLVLFFDSSRRVSVFRSAKRDVPPVIAIRQRGDLSADPQPVGGFALPVVGLATAFGLQPVRAHHAGVDLVVRQNDAVLTSSVDRFVGPLIVALLFAVVVAYAIARILTQQLLRPLIDVTAALERFASGDLSPQPIGADPKQEFGPLAVAYNGAIAQMERAFAERERANAAMRQFMTDAGHQLRTPLTVIRGFLGILRKGDFRSPADRDRILETMSAQTQIMGSLIDKLILLERWETGESEMRAEAIDVGQLVSDVAAPFVEANGDRRVQVAAPPGPLAAIDPEDLTHAITNLLDNALKYTSGAIKVGVRVDNGRIAVDVMDEGPGLDAKAAAHVFDRFYRGPQRDVPGSGLGLAIARRAIERAGGTLTLQSDPVAGSTFTIWLPTIAQDVHRNLVT
ncbi:MAG: HAMP domain-containing histidine kinase [Candidatus Eremiobacteraeota bacterium]|nr:HAMP domain-containing histidine kinase [Candidatus Eremiobacteraeota bacterium]